MNDALDAFHSNDARRDEAWSRSRERQIVVSNHQPSANALVHWIPIGAVAVQQRRDPKTCMWVRARDKREALAWPTQRRMLIPL